MSNDTLERRHKGRLLQNVRSWSGKTKADICAESDKGVGLKNLKNFADVIVKEVEVSAGLAVDPKEIVVICKQVRG